MKCTISKNRDLKKTNARNFSSHNLYVSYSKKLKKRARLIRIKFWFSLISMFFFRSQEKIIIKLKYCKIKDGSRFLKDVNYHYKSL
jgi:hypothetical protein